MTDFNKMTEPVADPARDIEAMVDLFHNDLISGHHGDIKVITMVTMDADRNLRIFHFGGETGSIAEAAGMFAFALSECYGIQSEK